MPMTIISTIPGSLDTKFVKVELGPEDACTACGSYPTYGLHATCDRCMQPACAHCMVQISDGQYCPTCARSLNTQSQDNE